MGRCEGGEISTDLSLYTFKLKCPSSVCLILGFLNSSVLQNLQFYSAQWKWRHSETKVSGDAEATWQCFRSWCLRNSRYLPKLPSPFIQRLSFKISPEANPLLEYSRKVPWGPRTSSDLVHGHWFWRPITLQAVQMTAPVTFCAKRGGRRLRCGCGRLCKALVGSAAPQRLLS